MQKEKKPNAKQKIALERIYRLFELAEEVENEKYSKKYLQLAKKLGEKMRVSIPKELKKKFCRKCHSMKIKQTKKAPFLIIKCEDCGAEKKYSLEAKTK